MSHAVEIEGLSHSFGLRRVLADVNLHVAVGECLALLGANGSGKSTLFRILSTMLVPDEGVARVFGRDVVREQAAARSMMGVVFQSPALDGVLTARENLVLHAKLSGLSRDQIGARVDESLREIGLLDRSRDRVATFSGGMKRKLEIAKAMLARPRLLILDEPDTGLDVPARAQLRGMLKRLTESGTTVLLTTHLLDQAEAADRVALLHAGRIVASDAPSALCAKGGRRRIVLQVRDPGATKDRLRQAMSLEAIEADGRLVIHSTEPENLLQKLFGSLPEPPIEVAIRQTTLEDVYLESTGHRLGDAGVA